MKYQAVDASFQATPLCELPHVTQAWMRQEMLDMLNDNDPGTCYTPSTARLTTARLNARGEQSALVKVRGDNMKCGSTDANIHVMNVFSDDGQGRRVFSMCQFHASFGWKGKQMCMFICNCSSPTLCSEVHMSVDPGKGVSICEFGVL